MYRYPTEVLVNFLLPAIFFLLPLSLSLIEFFIDRYIYIYIYNIYAYDTDILRKTLQKRERGGRSRKLAGIKKFTKNSVRNGTLQNGTFQKWYFPKMVLFNFEMYRYPTEVLVNFLLPAIFFPLPLSLSLIEFL